MPRRPDERGEPLVFRGTVASTEGVRLAGAELDWDTANIYSFGASEEIVGRAIRKFTRRDDIVRATKIHQHMHDGPGGSGLSRKAIIEQVERIANARGVSMATIASAWVLKHPVVDAPIVGVTREHHLPDAVTALDVELTDDEIAALEKHSTRREPTYF
jgi:aryl-alcohol dehydrogenase-like predicted oxidoreductase